MRVQVQVFSVNIRGKQVRISDLPPISMLLFLLPLMRVTTLTQSGLIFHVLLRLCPLFHLMKPTLVFISAQSFLSTMKSKKINVGTETVHSEASLGTY